MGKKGKSGKPEIIRESKAGGASCGEMKLVFADAGYDTLTSNRERWQGLGKTFVLQLTRSSNG